MTNISIANIEANVEDQTKGLDAVDIAILDADKIFHEAFIRINDQHDGLFYDEENRRVIPQQAQPKPSSN